VLQSSSSICTGAFVGPTIVVEAMGLGGTFMVVPLPDEKSMKQGTCHGDNNHFN
jgi:hypothetical protein